MTRLDELDMIELESKARCLDKNYTPEKFKDQWDHFVKLKTYIIMRRAREAKRKSLH